MNILHIIASLEVGGAQKMLAELLNLQIKQGHRVSVLVYKKVDSKYEHDIENNGCRLINLNSPNLKSPIIIPRLRKFLRENEIIHVHLFPSLYQVALANLGLNRVLIYTEHNTHNKRRNYRFLRPIEKWIYSRFDSIIAISNETKHNLAKWLNLSRTGDKHIKVIPNGINLETIRSSSVLFPPIVEGKYILMVSRFMPAKDQATLIRSIPYIKDKDIKIVFAGDGDTLQYNKSLAIELRVENRCLFLGSRDDVPKLIKGCTIGVQSSHWEGFGLTAVEFMAARKPVIASNVPGLSGVVDGAGCLFTQGNEKELASNINDLLDNQALYDELSSLSLKRAAQYDIGIMAQQYNDLYHTLV